MLAAAGATAGAAGATAGAAVVNVVLMCAWLVVLAAPPYDVVPRDT